MTEFKYGDRVVWTTHHIADKDVYLGTVVDERLPQNKPLGSFDECLPFPVAVLWDEPGEVWWENGNNLELA